MKVLILRNSVKNLDENNVLYSNAFRAKGNSVYFGLINNVSTKNYKVYSDVIECDKNLELNESLIGKLETTDLESFDLVWVMNQPHYSIANDVWQILWMLSKKIPFVNSIESINYLNNKNNLGLAVPLKNLPENYVNNSFEKLWGIYTQRKNEKWILKPTNSGCGADVFLLNPEGENARSLMQSMTGNTTAVNEISGDYLLGFQNKYSILQQYIPNISKGEKRVIIAGGEIIAFHGREIVGEDHRSNITQGGKLVNATLTEDEIEMCQVVGKELLKYGVNYIGLDICFPYILEFNIVNPGGMYDAFTVSGIDYSPDAIEHILNRIPMKTL